MLKFNSSGCISAVFRDSLMELGRLLHQAVEVEHSLLAQYIYAAFSIKDEYPSLHGFPMASAGTMLGVAIQEMQHLDVVNNLLRTLGFQPNLTRQDFPWESDIYPFDLKLEPLSKRSVAKYLYTEAPAGVFEPENPAYDAALSKAVGATLPGSLRINHVGSLYTRIIDVASSVDCIHLKRIPPLDSAIAQLKTIKSDGEVGHFKFFMEVFHGTHQGFNGVPNPWGLAPSSSQYPSLPLTPAAGLHVGDADAHAPLGRIGNLHYWLTLCLLDGYYRFADADLLSLAKAHMVGPLLGVGSLATQKSIGLPFDILDFGYAWAKDEATLAADLIGFLDEADALIANNAALFDGFDNSQSAATRSALNGKV